MKIVSLSMLQDGFMWKFSGVISDPPLNVYFKLYRLTGNATKSSPCCTPYLNCARSLWGVGGGLMLFMVLSELSSHRKRVSGDSPLAIRIVKAFLWGGLMGA